MTDDKFDELIQKQVQRENKMRQVREDFLDEMGELPKKQITVKLFPNTHKALKVIAASKDTTIEKIATAIIEDIMVGVKEIDCPFTVIENRREAIGYALSFAKRGDCIILAGKGHETYQIIGKEKTHFDEREVVAEFLESKKTEVDL